MTIPASWVETRPVLRGDKILSTPLDALRQNSDRTYYTRLRTLFSAVLFAGNLGQILTIVRTSKASSRKIRVSLYFSAAGDADVELETLNGSDTYSTTVTRGSAGLEVLDIDEAWIADDTSYYFRVLLDYGMGVSVLAVEAVEMDGEEADLAGIATIWPDCADDSSFQVSDVRVGDLQTTTDTGDQWQVQSLGPTVWERWILADRSSVAGLPTSDVATGAYATVLGLPYVWDGSNWVSSVVTISSWASRPRGSSSYDGRWGVCNNRVYRYSQTGDANDLGDWVPPEVYAGSVVFRARIVGDVVPASESPAWTHNVDGTGTVTQTGSVVRFSSTTGGPGQQATASINHGVSGGKYYMAGFLTASSLGETLGMALAVRNGTHLVFASTGNSSGNGWQASTTSALLSPKFATFASNVERWVELLWHNGVVTVLVDHTVVSMQLSSAFDVNVGTNFFIGDPGHLWRGILDVRQLRFVTF